MSETRTVYRLLRIAQNRSVKELATQLEITTAYVHSIENGERVPAKRLLRDYASALHVTPDYIQSFTIPQGESFQESLLRVVQHLCNKEVSS